MDKDLEWKKKSEVLIRDGYRKIVERTFVLPNGKEKSFEIKKEGLVVSVVALTADNKVILAKQYRPGPEKVLLEIPGGGVNPGEDLKVAMARELLEETGYAGDLEFVQSFTSGGYTTGIRHCFTATNCIKVQDPQLDDTEFIEVVLMPLPEFREHLRSGQLSDIHTAYLGLDHLGLL